MVCIADEPAILDIISASIQKTLYMICKIINYYNMTLCNVILVRMKAGGYCGLVVVTSLFSRYEETFLAFAITQVRIELLLCVCSMDGMRGVISDEPGLVIKGPQRPIKQPNSGPCTRN